MFAVRRQVAPKLVRSIVIGAAFVLVAAGCGDDDSASGDSTLGVDPDSSTAASDDNEEDHQSELAIGETPFITQFLVPVDGYRYVDDDGAAYERLFELHESIEADLGEDFFGAVSLHSVVADDPSQNTAQARNGDWEVGYLGLVQLNAPAPYGVDEQLALGVNPGPVIDQLDIAGVPVFVFEDAESRDSRFTYHWLDHGVQVFIDGADREPLERWLTAYLAVPKVAERETEEMAARLTALPGFAYSNVDTSTLPEQVDALGDVGYSMHKVADADGSIGIVTLSDATDPGLLDHWLADTFGLGATTEVTLGEGQARHFVGVVDGDQMHAFTWAEANLSGALTTRSGHLAIAERFLAMFLRPDSAPSDIGATGPSSQVDAEECVAAGSHRDLPLFDDFEGTCRVVGTDGEFGQEVHVVDGSLQVTLADSRWARWVDLKSPVPNLSVSVTLTMPAEGMVTLSCYGPRPVLDTFDYVVVATPTEVGFALYDNPQDAERNLLNRDVVDRDEIAEPMQIAFTCSADSDRVDLAGEVDWALLEASVGSEAETITSFQAVGIQLVKNEQAPDPTMFVLDNIAITE